jgi:protein O-GlcNAc transferase
MRAKVWIRRSDSPLFNCQIYAHDMERLFARMWQRHASGEKPNHITQWDDAE